jgi:hypothetical protein
LDKIVKGSGGTNEKRRAHTSEAEHNDTCGSILLFIMGKRYPVYQIRISNI